MMASGYQSACQEINPRLEKEVQDRERRIAELLRRAAGVSDENFDISLETRPETPQSSSFTLGPIINTEQIYVPNSSSHRPLDNDEAVTLEIRGDRFVEKGEHMKYEDSNRKHQVPVTLSSVKCRRPQKITLELRSAGPLVDPTDILSTHTIEVRQTKNEHSTTTRTYETNRTYDTTDSINRDSKGVVVVINNNNGTVEAESARDEHLSGEWNDVSYTLDESHAELIALRNKHMPTTAL